MNKTAKVLAFKEIICLLDDTQLSICCHTVVSAVGGMESSAGCGISDRGTVMASLMRMLEQSCEGVSPAGLWGQSVSAGGNSQYRGLA